MKTKDVIELLNISREALRHYEEQKLIHPYKEENGYRNYSQTDIETLIFILQLRDLDISIADIKLVLNNQYSLYDCLLKKQKSITKELETKKAILTKIQKNLSRRRMYFFTYEIPKGYEKEDAIIFTNQGIQMQEMDTKEQRITNRTFSYNQITNIEISICTRFDVTNSSVNFQKLKLEEYRFGGYNYVAPYYYCHIDFDIYIDQQIIKLESYNLKFIPTIFSLLQENAVVVKDPIGLLPIFTKYENRLVFTKEIERNIRKWKKEFSIDNPRMSSASDTFTEIWQEVKKVWSSIYNEIVKEQEK